MQFKVLAFAALVATVAAQNGTNHTGNVTTTGPPQSSNTGNAAVANVVSGGLFGGIVAAGLALVL